MRNLPAPDSAASGAGPERSTEQRRGEAEEEFDERRLTAPTLTQVGKMCVLQTIGSFGFDLELGDVSGAFLESGKLDREL